MAERQLSDDVRERLERIKENFPGGASYLLNATTEECIALAELSDDQWKQFVGALNGKLHVYTHLPIVQLFSEYGFDNVIRVITSWRLLKYYCDESKLITIFTMNISDNRLRAYLGSSSKDSYTLKSSAFEKAAEHLGNQYPEHDSQFWNAPEIEIYLIKFGEEIFGKTLTLAKKLDPDPFLPNVFAECEKILLAQSGDVSMTAIIDTLSKAAYEVTKLNYPPTFGRAIDVCRYGPENTLLLYGVIDHLQKYGMNFHDRIANINLEKAREAWPDLALETNDLFFQVRVIKAALEFLMTRTRGITRQLMDAVIASGTEAYEAAELKLHQSLATFLKEKGLEKDAADNDSMQLLLQKFTLILPKLLSGEEVKIRINEWILDLYRCGLSYRAIDPKKDMHFACELIIPTPELLADRPGVASIPENKGGAVTDMSDSVKKQLRQFCQKFKIPVPENSWEKVHDVKLQIGKTTKCECKGKGSDCSDSNDELCLNCQNLYEDIIYYGLERAQKYLAYSCRNGFPVSPKSFNDYGRCLELYPDSGEGVFIGYMHLSAMLGQELIKYGSAYNFNKEMKLREAVNRCYQIQLRGREVRWHLIYHFPPYISDLSYFPYNLPWLR